MFKRKPIYIILLILFTLLLAADVTAYCLTANASSGMPARPDGAMPQTSGGAMPQTSDGAMPQTSDGTMPQMGDGTMPQMGDGTMPQVSRDSGSWGNFDPSQMQGGFPGSTAVSAFASFIKSWWIPIGALCVLADALCILMLIRISKKCRQTGGETGGGETEPEAPKARKPQVSGYEKRRRKQRRTIRAVAVILSAVFALAVVYGVAGAIYEKQLEAQSAATIVSAEAVSAGMNTDISGTGTLTDAEAEEVTVPNGVEIAAYLVENGDTVAEGEVLATVDHTSVMKAIADLQAAMDLLDEEIDAAASDEIDSVITASVDGRVKAIYAQEGAAVADTMYDSGALMLISLDGLMAADIRTEADISAGESVTVTLADGTTETGRVDSVTDGIVTVTVTDDGTVCGEEVTVSDESGSALGTGTLYIHSELKITGFSGTVLKIKCSENEKISAGDTLMTLTDTEYTAEYQLLLAQRAAYEDEMMKLFKLYQDGNIYAGCAGTVAGLDEEEDADAADADAAEPADGDADTADTAEATTSQTGYTGAALVVESLVYRAALPSATLLGNNPAGADDTTVAAYANYAAAVSGVSYGSIALKEYPASLSITDYTAFASLGVTTAMMTAETTASPDLSTPVYMYENGAWAAYSVSDIAEGDVLILTYDASGNLVWIVIVSHAQNQGGGSGTGGAGGSGISGGTGGSTAAATETTEPEDLYAISETTVMSVTPGDKMSVTVTIDELDILSIKVGQEASITLDALGAQRFTGVVTSIDTAGTNSGGSTKYTAVVTLERTEDMLAGMNAAVSITVSSAQCAVTIPVAALVESGDGTYVYTSYDSENAALGSAVEVTTGLSDGTNVEILTGLSAGDEVWYEYDDTVDVSSSTVSSSSGGGFNLMRLLRGGRG